VAKIFGDFSSEKLQDGTMFTGIIEATGEILKKTESLLIIERPDFFDDIKIGSSISVSGVCLSIISMTDTTMEFNVVEETWSVTNLSSKRVGDRVNLERAVRADQRLDGHIVQGHVEGVGRVIALFPDPSPATGEESSAQKVVRRLGQYRYPPKQILRYAKEMRKKPTEAEAALWNALRRKQLNGFYFRRQRPVGRFIIDFYCEELRLGIELDGSVHDNPEEKQYDTEREEHLHARGVRIVRFSNDEVLENLKSVLEKMIQSAKQSPPHPFGGGARGGGILSVKLPKELIKFCVRKGSIAIEGVSLTIANIQGEEVFVALIPHTLENTTLIELQVGDSVNIERDITTRL